MALSKKAQCLVAVAVVFVTIGVTLVGSEIAFRLLRPGLTMGAVMEQDHRQGFRMIPNAQTQYYMDGRSIGVRINNVGLRQDEPVITPKPANERRILVVGDSFVFGFGVEADESFFSILQKKAQARFPGKNFHFINGGHGGFGTEQMLAFVEDHGFALEPDAIFFVMGPNDMDDNLKVNDIFPVSADGALTRNPDPKTTEATRSPLARFVPFYDWLLFHSYVVQFARPTLRMIAGKMEGAMTSQLPPPPAPAAVPANEGHTILGAAPTGTVFPRSVYEKSWALFSYLAAQCRKRHIELMVSECSEPSEGTLPFVRESREEMKKRGIDYFEVLDQWVQTIRPFPFEKVRIPDGHLNPYGNQLYAELVWPEWEKRLQKLP